MSELPSEVCPYCDAPVIHREGPGGGDWTYDRSEIERLRAEVTRLEGEGVEEAEIRAGFYPGSD